MKKVIRKRDSNVYLLKDGTWTGDTVKAWKAKTLNQAWLQAQKLKLRGVELLYLEDCNQNSVTAIIPLPNAA
jgi:hypothetical protein